MQNVQKCPILIYTLLSIYTLFIYIIQNILLAIYFTHVEIYFYNYKLLPLSRPLLKSYYSK